MSEKLETMLPQIIDYKEEMRLLQEKIDFLVDAAGKEMERTGEAEAQVYYNDEKSVKITRGPSSRKKLNKERLAERFRVEEDAVKTDFLMKKVDEDKLTYEQYKNSFYRESEMKVSVRLVKAE